MDFYNVFYGEKDEQVCDEIDFDEKVDVLYLGMINTPSYVGWDENGRLRKKVYSNLPQFIDKLKSKRLKNPLQCCGTIVIGDGQLDNVYNQLENPLKKFYNNGGSIIVLGEMGLFALPERLGKTFNCSWNFEQYTRYEMKATPALLSMMSAQRAKMKGLPYTKHNLLKVPDADAMFYPVNNHDEKVTPFASHAGKRGRLTYISCTNCHEQFLIIYRHLLNEHAVSSPSPVVALKSSSKTEKGKKSEKPNPAGVAMDEKSNPVGMALDEKRITAMAEQHGWHFAGRDIGTSMVAFEKEDGDGPGLRVNFWLSTGTVGSYLAHPKHPTKRRTQLFRQEVDHDEALKIIIDPRVHTGAGYTKKSNRRYYRRPKPTKAPAGPSIVIKTGLARVIGFGIES